MSHNLRYVVSWLQIRSLLLLFLMLLGFSATAFADELREAVNFNREWKFQLGDISGANAATFDDKTWSDVNLPHSFSMPYFAADRFYVGFG